jgi:exonuclease SbcC
MIPVRVQLRNFLCYDGEGDGVEFDFDGSPLWSISGDNGAGKSAIFDAITYTLFGQHRGGAQEDGRLIRSGARDCEASFEFRLDDRLYRVRRTVGRPRGSARQEPKTWQAAWFDPAVNDWRPIQETDRERGLARWVQEKLGFGFKTFVSSVLLLQGQSDRLIQAPPQERFGILSGLLDLEPYKRLEAAAIDRRKAAQARAQDLEGQLRSMPPVAAEDLEQANTAVLESEQAIERVQAEAAQAEVALNEARRYTSLTADLCAAEATLAETEQLLQDAEQIRGDYQEWQRLFPALPKLKSALEDLAAADSQAAEAEQSRSRLAVIDLVGLKRAAAQAEKQEQQAGKQCAGLRKECDILVHALPPLREILHRRRDLAERERSVAEHGAPDEWQKQVAQRHQTIEKRREEKRKTEEEQRRAIEAGANARAALHQAQTLYAERQEAKDEAVCSRCGQKVDAKHIRSELAAASNDVDAARAQMDASTGRFRDAERRATEATTRLEAASRELEQANQALAISCKADEERQRALASLESALQAAAEAPAELRDAVVGATLDEVEEAVRLLSQQMKDMTAQVRTAEEAEQKARQRSREAQQTYQQSLHERQELEAQAQRLDDAARGLRRQADVRLADVDPDWRKRALAQDQALMEGLSARARVLDGIEGRYAALQRADAQRGQLEMRVDELKRSLEAVDRRHRMPVEEAQRRRQQAEDARRESQRRCFAASEELRRLTDRQERRQGLEAELAAASTSRRLYGRLADLLGRNGLQAFLMDEAIQGISHLANETLSRISGAQLTLDIERHATAKGEEEITIKSTDLASSDEPLDVQFVSGSQKFRTSVALAAGIGQYAGRGAGSVRSLIIDEGFGSLDLQGRQEIIDELRNLSQLMDRIIVVSHQEDFQDRTLFPTGYVLRKVGQRTEVERFV